MTNINLIISKLDRIYYLNFHGKYTKHILYWDVSHQNLIGLHN